MINELIQLINRWMTCDFTYPQCPVLFCRGVVGQGVGGMSL